MLKRGQKLGQTTIFIIIAIVIVAAVILFFTLTGSDSIKKVSIITDPIYNHISSCFETTAEQAIPYIALHGGYYNVPEQTSIIYFTENIPYYFLNGRDYTPSITKVESEISDYISDNIQECMNLTSFINQGFEITQEIPKTSSVIEDNKIKFRMSFIVNIKKGEEVFQIKNFNTEIDSNLKNLYDASLEITEVYAQEPGMICITCLEGTSNQYSVEIKANPVSDISIFEKDIIWFFISDKKDISEDKLTWVFIVEQ